MNVFKYISFNSINIIRVEEFHEKSIYDKVKRGHL